LLYISQSQWFRWLMGVWMLCGRRSLPT
jgi:hypothetical protein